MIIKSKSSFLLFLTSGFLFLAPSLVHGATLSFSSGQGYAVGQSFPVNVLVSTASGESINAVSASISYSPEQLSLASIGKDNSIITLWASNPTYSNVAGTVDLEGVVPNPGYSGQGGNVITLNFIAKAGGPTTLTFTQASVLANDGQGTDVLTAAPSESIYLGGASPNASSNGGVPAGAPSAPVITSNTNPDPTKWYNNPDPSFSWSLPPDVTAVRLQYDASPIATPSVVYSPAIASKTLSNVPDGVYYFHAQFENAEGWGAIAHFKFSIDTVPPAPFKISEAHPDNSTDPRPILYFDTTDALSGMDHYDVKVGDLAFQTVDAAIVASNPYTPPTQTSGEKTVVVNAYDKAGNETTESATIDIQSIDPPVIDSFPNDIQQGDLLRILGRTYPDSTVTVTVKDSSGVQNTDTTFSNSDGKFGITWSRQLDPGLYTFTATVTNGNGAVSSPTDPLTVAVGPRTVFWLGSLIINYLSLILIVILALAFLAWVALYAYHRLLLMRRKIRHTVSEAERSLHHRFDELQDELADHLRKLESTKDKRQLTREEKAILDSLRRHLGAAEKDIDAKLDQLGKESKWTR